MKKLGILIVAMSAVVGYFCVYITIYIWFERALVFSIMCFLGGILLIYLDDNFPKKGSVPKMENPPAPPKKCICNDIEKHSPGGRCEADHSKGKYSFGLPEIDEIKN